MHFKKTALAALAAIVFLTNCNKTEFTPPAEKVSPNAAARSTSANGGEVKGVSNYLILCKTHAVSSQLLSKINALGTVKQSLNQIGVVVASSSNANFETEMEKLPEVQSVTPDIKMDWLKSTFNEATVVAMSAEDLLSQEFPTSGGLGLSGANPLVPLQWSLLSVNSEGAFKAGYKGNGALVAVLDGGFHLQHPDIVNNIAGTPVSFVPGQGPQMANPNAFSHGSHVAGIIAASDNNIGIAGIAPSAKLMLVKVLADNGSGEFSWLIQGVLYAADKGADIINISAGALIPRNGKFLVNDGDTPDDPSDDVYVHEAREVQDLITALNRAFQYAKSKGTLTIAAAGNDYKYVTGQGQGSFYPANCTHVVAIAANSPRDWVLNQNTFLYEPSSYTNTGASLISLAGPGGDFDGSTVPVNFFGIRPAWVYDMVLSIGGRGNYTWAAGTSMASPAAAGVAALIVGKYAGNISPAELESKLKASALNLGSTEFYGKGQVNAGNAVQQ